MKMLSRCFPAKLFWFFRIFDLHPCKWTLQIPKRRFRACRVLPLFPFQDWLVQSGTSWSSIFSLAFGKHLRGAPDVQSHRHAAVNKDFSRSLFEFTGKCFIESLPKRSSPWLFQEMAPFSSTFWTVKSSVQKTHLSPRWKTFPVCTIAKLMCITILNTWKRSSSMRLLKRWIRWWRTTSVWICCNFAPTGKNGQFCKCCFFFRWGELAHVLRHETPASCRSKLSSLVVSLTGCLKDL